MEDMLKFKEFPALQKLTLIHMPKQCCSQKTMAEVRANEQADIGLHRGLLFQNKQQRHEPWNAMRCALSSIQIAS